MTKKKQEIKQTQTQHERELRDIVALMEEQSFESEEEANEFLQAAVLSGNFGQNRPLTPAEEAQNLIDKARDSTVRRRKMLIKKALKLDPDCVEAWILMAEKKAENNLQKAIIYARNAVAAGERSLGPEIFKEGTGHFWGIVATRPYMRAMQLLAELLRMHKEHDEAITVYQKILQLNPGDNQGVRYVLVGYLPGMGHDDLLRSLLDDYKGEGMAFFGYAQALWTFQHEGAGPEADAALREAFKANAFVPEYLLGERTFPAELPDYFSPQDKNEAVTYVSDAVEGWLTIPGAMEWLAERYILEGPRQ